MNLARKCTKMGIKRERDFKEQEKERKRPLKIEVGKRELTTKKSFFFFILLLYLLELSNIMFSRPDY